MNGKYVELEEGMPLPKWNNIVQFIVGWKNDFLSETKTSRESSGAREFL